MHKLLSQLFHRKHLDNALEARRLALLLDQSHISVYIGFFVASVISYLILTIKMQTSMLLWVTLLVIIMFTRGIAAHLIRTSIKQGKQHYSLYFSLYAILIIISGIYWGIGSYLFFPDTDNVELFVTFVTFIAAISAAHIASLASSLSCYFAFLIPTMSGLMIRLYQIEYYMLFVSFLVYFVLLTLIAIRLNRITLQGLCLDIENERLIENASLEKELAHRANIEKSQFLAAASHDLRQPLNSMGLFLYTLRERLKPFSDKKPITLLNQIDNAYLALKNLLDSLLEISHLDAGTLQAEIKNIQLDFILRPLTDEMREEATRKGLDLNYNPSPCSIKTDPVLLSRIIRNLISNAIKYTNKGKIEIKAIISGKFVDIQVIDTGIGIPEHEFDTIFNEYHQLANKHRDRRQGIGLGLALVKKISAIINADVKLISTLNKGSTFTLRIAMSDTADTSPETISHTLQSLTGTKILVIDDEPDILYAMDLLLSGWQCQINTADSYHQALCQIANVTPDIILCDYRLQENFTGIEAIEKLHREIGHAIPAIIITGDTDPVLLRLINAKGYLLISKPIQPSLLHKYISLLTQSRIGVDSDSDHLW